MLLSDVHLTALGGLVVDPFLWEVPQNATHFCGKCLRMLPIFVGSASECYRPLIICPSQHCDAV
jgi:hypothetical protein